jgi:hypothetical protein
MLHSLDCKCDVCLHRLFVESSDSQDSSLDCEHHDRDHGICLDCGHDCTDGGFDLDYYEGDR